jgi:hypothetical protein
VSNPGCNGGPALLLGPAGRAGSQVRSRRIIRRTVVVHAREQPIDVEVR